jgi:hypothetical protein
VRAAGGPAWALASISTYGDKTMAKVLAHELEPYRCSLSGPLPEKQRGPTKLPGTPKEVSHCHRERLLCADFSNR